MSGNWEIACPQPLAAAAGQSMVELGGNAVDVAVATALAQGVVDPLMCGLGGTARAMVFGAKSRSIGLYRGSPFAGALARPDVFRIEGQGAFPNRFNVADSANYLGHTAVVTPSALRVLYDVQSQHGKLPWRTLVSPAIRLAHDGFCVYSYLYRHWDDEIEAEAADYGPPPSERLKASAAAEDIYLRNGQVYKVGETLRQVDYGNTLELVASMGADVFYSGSIAAAIAEDFRRHGGFVTREDLERTRTVVDSPIAMPYKEWTVYTDGPPGVGPSYLQALNLFGLLEVDRCMEPLQFVHVLGQVFNLVYGVRARSNGDPDVIPVDLDAFLDTGVARALSKNVRADSGLAGPPSGSSKPFSGSDSTTSVSVRDSDGDACIITHSCGSSSGVITPGLGFLYNNHMHNFDPHVGSRNGIAPGKRAEHGVPQVMWFDGKGRLRLINASLSRFALTADLQVSPRVLGGEMDLKTAIELPRFHTEYEWGRMYVEEKFPGGLVGDLAALGWKIERKPMTAPLCMVMTTPDGKSSRAMDPRGGWPG